jgi:hypothetical protein
VYVCGSGQIFNDTQRVSWNRNKPCLLGWPSNRGIITLNLEDITDFGLLGIDGAILPQIRYRDKAEEDGFCAKMLLIGGEWW